MTGNKRFKVSQGYNDRYCHDLQENKLLKQYQAVELMNALYEENMIFRTFIELNDFDADEILLQGKGLE